MVETSWVGTIPHVKAYVPDCDPDPVIRCPGNPWEALVADVSAANVTVNVYSGSGSSIPWDELDDVGEADEESYAAEADSEESEEQS